MLSALYSCLKPLILGLFSQSHAGPQLEEGPLQRAGSSQTPSKHGMGYRPIRKLSSQGCRDAAFALLCGAGSALPGGDPGVGQPSVGGQNTGLTQWSFAASYCIISVAVKVDPTRGKALHCVLIISRERSVLLRRPLDRTFVLQERQ